MLRSILLKSFLFLGEWRGGGGGRGEQICDLVILRRSSWYDFFFVRSIFYGCYRSYAYKSADLFIFVRYCIELIDLFYQSGITYWYHWCLILISKWVYLRLKELHNVLKNCTPMWRIIVEGSYVIWVKVTKDE